MSAGAGPATTGRGRALLIGCSTYGLRGCEADVALVDAVLRRCGFDEIATRTGADASRAGILDAAEELVAATRPGDAVVLYWSGHGGRVGRPDFAERTAAGLSPHYQFLVPSDLGPEPAEGFAGLLSEEVSTLQRRLTDAFLSRGATPNVTTVLDCCHAGYLARDASLRPRALSAEQVRSFPLQGIRARAQEAAAQQAALPRNGAWDTNPHAVRLVAAQAEQSAFERDDGEGVRGVFTAALTEVLGGLLDERGRCDVPWSVIGDLVRTRVQARAEGQRPAVEGPGTVLPFSTARAARSDAVAVTVAGDALRIDGAGLLGIRPHDVFALQSPDARRTFGTATVERLQAGSALLRRDGSGTEQLPEGVRAVPRRLGAVRRPVLVEVGGAVGADLLARIEASPRLVPAAAGERPFAVVAPAAGGALRVLDELRVPARTTDQPGDDAGLAAVVELLEVMARGRALVELASGEGPAALSDPVDVSFAAVRDGRRRELPRRGARVVEGERLSLRVANLADRPLFLWVFDVGTSGRTALITNAAPSGTRLGPRGEIDDARVLWGEQGAPVSWPADVPVAGEGLPPERAEAFVLVLADRPQDLGPLATARGGPPARPARSALELALEAVRGGAREMDPLVDPAEQQVRYRVEVVSFAVVPRAAAGSGPGERRTAGG